VTTMFTRDVMWLEHLKMSHNKPKCNNNTTHRPTKLELVAAGIDKV